MLIGHPKEISLEGQHKGESEKQRKHLCCRLASLGHLESSWDFSVRNMISGRLRLTEGQFEPPAIWNPSVATP